MPLLDVQVKPGLRYFSGLQSVTVSDYNGADIMEPHYLGKYPHLDPASVGCVNRTAQCPGLVSIVALNCSRVPGCTLSGITLTSASGFEGAGTRAPAVRVFDGEVDSVTVLSSQLTGAADVLDSANVPRGSWASRSAGGFTIVSTTDLAAKGTAVLTAAGGKTRWGSTRGHALLVGESGDTAARLAIETNGALRWGDGVASDFDTTLARIISNASTIDLPPLDPGAVTTANVTVRGADVQDVVTSTLSSLGDALVFVSARVAAASRVLVIFRNEGLERVDLPSGVLRVAVSKFV